MEAKRDFSVSMARANVMVLLISLPVAMAQFVLFSMLHGPERLVPTWNSAVLISVILLGIVLHELIHGLSWVIFGGKSFGSIRFGFQWKTLTPYAHLTEPVEVTAYRTGAFLPGFILGIMVYLAGLVVGEGGLFLFGLLHTAAAGGDWLVLWLIRNVKRGTLVEDHPTHAGCYVLES